jgi:hypothetical protein
MGRWWRSSSRGDKIAVIGVLATVVGIVLPLWITLRPTGEGAPPAVTDGSAATTITVPATTADSTDTTLDASGTSLDAVDASSEATGTVTRYLAIDSSTTDSQQIPWYAGYVSDQGPQDINGTSYPRNLTFTWECSSSSENYADYNLGRHYENFHAVIGPGDTSTQTYHFEVWLDGEREYSATLRHGQSRKVNLSVKGVLSLRVAACGMKSEQMAYRGGVFGEPRVTGKASEVPPPTTSG